MENRAAKRHSLPMVGTVFLHKSEQPHWQNGMPTHHSFLHILPNRLRHYLRDIHYPFRCFWELLFLPHWRPKKRSKRMSVDYCWIFKTLCQRIAYFVKFVIKNIIWTFQYSNNPILSVVILSQ